MTAIYAIPIIAYKDVVNAVEWLKDAFGFTIQRVVSDNTRAILHYELILGNVVIMVGSSEIKGIDSGSVAKNALNYGKYVTQSQYLVIDNPDKMYENVLKQGAKIVIEIQTNPNGERFFSCFDPEGHLWSFGSYDPRKA